MRLASAVLAACAAAIATSDSSAADEAPKANAAKPLRLKLDAGKTYLYRLSETIVVRQKEVVPEAGELTFETRTEVVWDVGMSLQRVEPGGDSIVSLLPTRVRGEITAFPDQPRSFDSEASADPATSKLLGRGISVRLSPRGHVLVAAGPLPPIGGFTPDVKAALTRLGVDFERPFAEQFFHELPQEAPKKDLAWEQARALAPEWNESEREIRGSFLGDVTEKSVVQALAADSITATLRAHGKSDAPRREKPLDGESIKLADLAEVGEQLDAWLVLGEVRIRRDSGLVAMRKASYTLETHSNPLRLPKGKAPPVPGAGSADVEVPGADRTHEITLQLDLVDVR